MEDLNQSKRPAPWVIVEGLNSRWPKWALVVLLFCSLAAQAKLITSPKFPTYPTCEGSLLSETLFGPAEANKGADKLYYDVTAKRWELDDYGPVYRHATVTLSESKDLLVEEYNTSLDLGPSRMWIQTLQKLGQMPVDLNVLATDPRGVRWSDIDRFIDRNGLDEFAHGLREPHLNSNRMQYAAKVWPGFQFALSQYPRRAWFTPAFAVGATETFNRTLRNASYIFLRSKKSNEVVASIRMVRVSNGLLRLKHVKSGRVLEIMGNSEITWGGDGKFRPGWPSLKEAYEANKFVHEFMKSAVPVMKRDSGYDPVDLIRLPMEQSLHIELPRNWEFLPLEGHNGFGPGGAVTIGGEMFTADFGHAMVVEPGLFALAKNEERAANFIELTIWMSKYLANPRIPEWINARKVGYWTYNDLPLYRIFGFDKDKNFPVRQKFGVSWDTYGASYDSIFSALAKLSGQRSDGTDRTNLINGFLLDMEKRGF